MIWFIEEIFRYKEIFLQLRKKHLPYKKKYERVESKMVKQFVTLRIFLSIRMVLCQKELFYLDDFWNFYKIKE